jgi:general stress protein 26
VEALIKQSKIIQMATNKDDININRREMAFCVESHKIKSLKKTYSRAPQKESVWKTPPEGAHASWFRGQAQRLLVLT